MSRSEGQSADTTAVEAPVSLLLDPELMPSAKVIWMVLMLYGPMRTALLEARSGLSRPTVLAALAHLAAVGCCATAAGPPAAVDRAPAGPRVTVPGALLADRRVGARAKVLYGILQLTPQFRGQSGQFTYPGLSGLARTGRNTVKRAVGELAAAGWLRIAQLHVHTPMRFWLGNPALVGAEAEVDRARRRLEGVRFKGEALMREYLSLLVDSDDFEDNAAPGFLVNPQTGERMQFDRFYPPSVAFEFNGPQHYGPTERFTAADAAKQRARDYMKLGICLTRGITLVVIHPADLSLEAMEKKVGQLLPLRNLEGHEPLKDFLKSLSRKYRQKVRLARRSRPAPSEEGPG